MIFNYVNQPVPKIFTSNTLYFLFVCLFITNIVNESQCIDKLDLCIYDEVKVYPKNIIVLLNTSKEIETIGRHRFNSLKLSIFCAYVCVTYISSFSFKIQYFGTISFEIFPDR